MELDRAGLLERDRKGRTGPYRMRVPSEPDGDGPTRELRSQPTQKLRPNLPKNCVLYIPN
jgi:hypothetical protein